VALPSSEEIHQRRGEQNDAQFHVASTFASERGKKGLHRPCGHTHFWHRNSSRRDVLKTIAGGAALGLTAGLWNPAALVAGSSAVAPNPIPTGFEFEGELFHVFPPAPGVEMATITDLVGIIGATAVQGTGTGVDHDGQSMALNFGADMRFMQGRYIGVDGKPHQTAFGYI
jgi:hypothetical protein